MAEVVGLVASVVTLGDVAIKVTRLRSVWNEIKNAPKSIESKLDELEALNAVIAEVEADSERDALNRTPAGTLSLRYCKTAAAKLDGLIQHLQTKINARGKLRRHTARIKVLLDADSIIEVERQLYQALQVLQCALTLYTCALTKLVPERTVSLLRTQDTKINENAKFTMNEVSTLRKRKPSSSCSYLPSKEPLGWLPDSFFGCMTKSHGIQSVRLPNGHTEEVQSTQVRVRLPMWLSQTLWDILVYQSVHGLTWNISSWNIRPKNSLIFKAVREGFLQSIREMLASGEASLHDRDINGETLLHLATEADQLPTAMYLIELGHPVHEGDNKGLEPHAFASLWTLDGMGRWGIETILNYFHATISGKDFTGHATAFISPNWSSPIAPLFGHIHLSNLNGWNWCFWNVPGLAKLIDKELCLGFKNLSLSSRLSTFCWETVRMDALEYILSDFDMTVDDLKTTLLGQSTQHSLTSFVQGYIHCGWSYKARQVGRSSRKVEFARWRVLTRRLVTGLSLDVLVKSNIPEGATGEILHMTALLRAIFSNMIEVAFLAPPLERYKRAISRSLKAFVEDLAHAGIDLAHYGRREVALLTAYQHVLSRRCTSVVFNWGDGVSGPYLVSMKYGSKPEDWDIIWDDVVEEFAGEFWDMLENQMPRIPGAWEE